MTSMAVIDEPPLQIPILGSYSNREAGTESGERLEL